jgi:hypothetical protein
MATADEFCTAMVPDRGRGRTKLIPAVTWATHAVVPLAFVVALAAAVTVVATVGRGDLSSELALRWYGAAVVVVASSCSSYLRPWRV